MKNVCATCKFGSYSNGDYAHCQLFNMGVSFAYHCEKFVQDSIRIEVKFRDFSRFPYV
jgi:hypothetical protein